MEGQLIKMDNTFFSTKSNLREVTQSVQDFIQDGLYAIYQNDPGGLNDLLKTYRKAHKKIADMPKSNTEAFVYECGMFNGAYKVLLEIRQLYEEQEQHNNILRTSGRQKMLNILAYLYDNPNVNQRKIVQEVKVSPDDLSEILNTLVQKGYVERYDNNKGARYVLKREGRKIVRDEVLTSGNYENI